MHLDKRSDTIRWIVAVVAIAFALAGGRFSHADVLGGKPADHSHVIAAAGGHTHDQEPRSGHSGHRSAGEVHCDAPILVASDMPEMAFPCPADPHRAALVQSLPQFNNLLDPPPPRFVLQSV